jgi:hypothetical protein
MAMCYNRRLWGLGYAYGFRPWMPRHPWHGYGYVPHIKKTLLFKDTDPVTLVFNSDAGDFDRPMVQPFAGEAPEGINCFTSRGLIVWTGHNSRAGMGKGFFLFDARKMAWQRFPVKNERQLLPKRLEYDSKRNQIIVISGAGNVYLYSMADGKVKALPADNKKVLPKGINSYSFCEFRYVPSANMLVDMMGYAYDLEAKRWVRLKLDTTALTTGYRLKGEPKPAGSTIRAMTYDPKRDLLWTVDGSWHNGGVFVMKLDARKARQ